MKMRGNFLSALILVLAGGNNLFANLWSWIVHDGGEKLEVTCDKAVVATFLKEETFPHDPAQQHEVSQESAASFSYRLTDIPDGKDFCIEFPKGKRWRGMTIDCRGDNIFSVTFDSAVPGQGLHMAFYEIDGPLMICGQNCSIPVMFALKAVNALLFRKDN